MNMKNYESLGYNPQQLHQIEDGLKQGIDITEYAGPQFDWMQMEQIKLGLLEGLDVSIYANADIPANRMEHIREKREIESGRTEIQEHSVKQSRLKSWTWRLRIIAIILVIGIAGYYGWHYFSMMNQDLFITFAEPEVSIEYGQIFVPMKYVKDYTKDDNVELVLPDSIEMNVLGDQEVMYQIKNLWKTESFELTVHVVDTQSPVITLNSHDVTLTEGEDMFTPEAYIVSVIDNADGNLADRLTIDADPNQTDQTVIYTVQDSSGNVSTEQLELHWKKPPEPEVVYVEKPVYVGGNAASGNEQSNNGGLSGYGYEVTHGTQSFMFADGYDLDSGYAACAAVMNQIGYGSCVPLTGGDGFYIGYQLNY